MPHVIRSKLCLIDSKRLHYLESGLSSSPPLVLIHAWPACCHMYLPLIKKLSKKFHLYAPDLPGFGSSDPVTHYGYDSSVNTLSQFLNSQQLSRVYLCGVSLGAAVSLKFTHKYPHQVIKLILNSPPIYSLKYQSRSRLIRSLISRFPQLPIALINFSLKHDLVLSFYHYLPRYRQIDKKLINRIYHRASRNLPDAIIQTLYEILNQDLRPLVPQVKPATLLLLGDHDYPELLTDAEFLKQNLPALKFISLPDSNHTLSVSRHGIELFAQNIIEFLS